jgi:hypothetical protein
MIGHVIAIDYASRHDKVGDFFYTWLGFPVAANLFHVLDSSGVLVVDLAPRRANILSLDLSPTESGGRAGATLIANATAHGRPIE